MQTQCLSMVGHLWVEIPMHQMLSTCSHNVVNTTNMESPRVGHWETCPSFKRFTIELSRRSRCYAQAKVLQLKSKLWNISNILKFNGSCYFVFANVLEFFKCIMHHTKNLLCELIGLVNTLIKESMSYFPTSYLMDVVGLVYLQYWIQCQSSFQAYQRPPFIWLAITCFVSPYCVVESFELPMYHVEVQAEDKYILPSITRNQHST
jgi:hypothetical protein